MIKKALVVTCLAFTLTGCIKPEVSTLDKLRAEFVCKDQGGVYIYGIRKTTWYTTCNSGKVIKDLPDELPEKYWLKGE